MPAILESDQGLATAITQCFFQVGDAAQGMRDRFFDQQVRPAFGCRDGDIQVQRGRIGDNDRVWPVRQRRAQIGLDREISQLIGRQR